MQSFEECEFVSGGAAIERLVLEETLRSRFEGGGLLFHSFDELVLNRQWFTMG